MQRPGSILKSMSFALLAFLPTLAAALCALFPSGACAQSLQSVAAVDATNYAALCGDIVNSAAGATSVTAGTANCTTTAWSDGTGSGSGSATVITAYGSIRAVGAASQSINPGNTPLETVTTAAGQFEDVITFPTLTTGAFLQATLTVQGALTGDPLSYLSSNMYLLVNGVTNVNCQVLSLTGNCAISVAVSPGDSVNFFGTMTIYAVTNQSGSSSGTMNYEGKQKKTGANFTLALVDASGRPIKGVPIVTASGVTYATK